jgi:DNA-binding beta-propeller fold protein YncE
MLTRACHRIVSVVIAALIVATALSAQQSPNELFQRARMLEETGHPAEAISIYAQVVSQSKAAGNRALASRAQFRIGVLNKRLGRGAEAQKAFKAVITEYPDQIEVAGHARARLVTSEVNREKPAIRIKRTGPSTDGQFLATLTFPKRQFPSAAAFDPRRQRLYLVTQKIELAKAGQKLARGQKRVGRMVYWPSTLVVIDTNTQSVRKTVSFPVFLGDISFNPTNGKLYAGALVDGHVRVIDPVTFNTKAMIRVPGYPGLSVHCVNPVTNKIYVGSQGFSGNDKLFVIDGATNSLSGRFDLGGVAAAIVVNQVNNRVYVATDDRTRVFSGTDNSVLADLPGMHVHAVDYVQNRVYALSTQRGLRNDLLVLDGDTHTKLATFKFDDLVENIGLDRINRRLFAPLPSRNQVAVIDTTTLTEINRFRIAGTPKNIYADQGTGAVYFYTGENAALRVVSRETLHSERIANEFSDEFNDADLGSEWKILKGFGSYSLIENPGFLRFRVAIPSSSSPGVILMRKFRGDNWTLDTKVTYFTGTTGGGRDLRFVISFGGPPLEFGTEPDSIIISRGRDSWNDCCPGGISIEVVDDDRHVSMDHPPPVKASETYYWRIKRAGNTLSVENSDDGIAFTVVGSHEFGPKTEKLVQYFSITCHSHPNKDAYADYDYVRLTTAP